MAWKASEQTNMQLALAYLDLMRFVCVPLRLTKNPQEKVCISRMLCTDAAD